MTIRAKAISIGLAVFAIYTLLVYAAFALIIFPSFEQLEREEAQKDLNRCEEVIQKEIEFIDKTCFDWAAWDDLYRFVQDRNGEFASCNLLENTFHTTDHNVIYVVDLAGEVLWGAAYDLEKMVFIEAPESASKGFLSDNGLLATSDDSVKRGVYNSRWGPCLVSSRAIVTSENKGPFKGTMIMGKLLTPGMIESIANQAKVDLAIVKADASFSRVLADETGRRSNLGNPYSLSEISDGKLKIESIFRGLDGDPALALEILRDRRTLAEGKRSQMYALFFVMLSGVILLVVLVVMLERFVLGRVRLAAETVEEIASSKDSSRRLAVEGDDEISRLEGGINVMLDALDEKDADLKAREERLRRFIEQSPNMVALFDKNKKILLESRRWRETFNLEGDMLGMSYLDVYPYLPEEIKDAHDRALVGVENIAGESELSLPGKPPEWIRWKVHPWRDPLGEPAGFIVFIELITEIKAAEAEKERMERRAAYARKLESMGTVAGGIAHNFNNILTSVIGHIDLVMIDESFSREASKGLANVRNSAMRAAEICAKMVSYAGKGGITLERHAVEEIIREAAEEISLDLPEGIEIGVELEEDLPEMRLDPTQMKRALMNVMANAAESMEDAKGKVLVKVGLGKCDEATLEKMPEGYDLKKGECLFIQVFDQGKGMDKDLMEKIFDPFFTTGLTGRGLGLAEVQGIIRSHGGGIILESDPGKGTTFTIVLQTLESNGNGRVKAQDM